MNSNCADDPFNDCNGSTHHPHAPWCHWHVGRKDEGEVDDALPVSHLTQTMVSGVVGNHPVHVTHDEWYRYYAPLPTAEIMTVEVDSLSPPEDCGDEVKRLREALEAIASIKYGVQGIYEEYSDHNERNYRELVYWRDLAQRYQERARAALTPVPGER